MYISLSLKILRKNKLYLPFAFKSEYMKKVLATAVVLVYCTLAGAQTSKSLFWKKDGVQVSEIVSQEADLYKEVGHHGPAVENTHFALRIYFNDSGAIDVYSKSGRGLELEQYKWYPTAEQQEKYGAGCDEYRVGKTVGLGGIALWDGKSEVKLKATRGRTARVGDTKNGSFAEMIAYGVPYMKDTVDISIRIDMSRKTRTAVVTASELSGKEVMFLTGVNYHPGETVKCGDGFIFAWGIHPADVSESPIPIGAGMFYKTGDFGPMEVTPDMIRIISKPASSVSTTVVAASTKEAELNTAKRFENFMIR